MIGRGQGLWSVMIEQGESLGSGSKACKISFV